MIRYISLLDIRKKIAFQGDFTDVKQKESAIKTLEESCQNDSVELGFLHFPLTEVIDFLKSVNTQNQLFYEWIDQHESLRYFLLNCHANKRFVDFYRWKDHQLYSDFKHLLSPYLIAVALKNKDAATQQKALIFSFLTLLPADDRMVLEQELFKGIRNQIEQEIEKSSVVTSEVDLLEIVQHITDENILHVINDLSRTSYATKVWYVDQLLLVIQQPACTPRLANLILKQLKQIELNPEHQAKIDELKSDLRLGKITVKNSTIKKQKGLPIKLIFSVIFFGLLLSTIGWIIWSKPFSSTDTPLFNTKTSFEQFSKTERKRIDSLLRQIQQNRASDTDEIDPNQSILGNGVSIEIRAPFENKNMENLYQDLMKDADLHEKGMVDSCNAFSKKDSQNQFYQNVKDAKLQKGTTSIFFKNESDYSVYIIAFENNQSGKIVSHVITEGASLTLQLNEFDELLFLPGNDLGPFLPSKNATNLPSKKFTHHFCTVDFNFSQSLNTVYSLSRPQSSNNKLLFTGDKNTYFTVVDLYGILEVL